MPVPLIDHVIVNARDDLDSAVARYAQLGFALTPRGHHTLGSINNLAVLGTDYIELLGVPPGAGRTDVMDWPAGLNGLAFKTNDSDALYAQLKAQGVPALPPQEFSRPVRLPDGSTRDAAFRTVRLEPGAVPSGRVFFCHHLTPELVWTEDRLLHANGATGLRRVVIAAEDAEALAELFARMFGERSVRRTATGCVLVAGLATVEVSTPMALTARLGSAMPDPAGRSQFMAALTLRTTSLDQVWAEVPEAVRFERGLLVPANAAGGAALIFRE
jgi:catechol 2,3-dioxygenase-like lactoylglutathione lyase family enzyme